jgi:hypothetical protein
LEWPFFLPWDVHAHEPEIALRAIFGECLGRFAASSIVAPTAFSAVMRCWTCLQ